MAFALGLGLGACCVLAWWLIPGSQEMQVEIPNGLAASETALLLKRQGIIRSATLFKLASMVTGMDRSLKPGLYVLRRHMAAPLAVWRLHQGRIQPIKIVIPEGFMAKQIADRLEANAITDAGKFMEYVRGNHLEGFLFPTTYLFAKDLSPQTVAHHMHVEFRRNIEPLFKESDQTRFSLKQVITLASIVQREAAVVDEMPQIASVYSNRLRRRMRLEADPTVQYAMGAETGEWYKGLRHKHLEIPSRYNTYRYFGLPPGPICSPGVDAVRAALSPPETEALYFVAQLDGRHIFSRTFAEHRQAIAKTKAAKRRLKYGRKR